MVKISNFSKIPTGTCVVNTRGSSTMPMHDMVTIDSIAFEIVVGKGFLSPPPPPWNTRDRIGLSNKRYYHAILFVSIGVLRGGQGGLAPPPLKLVKV